VKKKGRKEGKEEEGRRNRQTDNTDYPLMIS
jgi:hypothetical protein